MSLLRSFYLRLVVPPNPFRFDPRSDRLVERLCRDHSDEWVLNLGSGMTDYGPHTVNLDLRRFRRVQVCGDGERLPFRDDSFAGVLARGVLEHVHSAENVRAEVLRVLRPRGFIYVEVPFLQPLHLSPGDYRRFTLPGLRSFLADFEEVEAGVQIGPASSLAWILREALASLLSFGSPAVYTKLLTLVGWMTFWLKYLDVLIAAGPHVASSASALYFLGRKRA